jgi:hypothetical protein
MATEVNKILLEVEVNSAGVVKNLDQLNKQLGQVGLQASKAKKEMDGLGGAAGIAGATAAEFGRLISDLPYGLQAVTNNISQLGSMFALLVSSSGGAIKALKNLGSVLLGPAGILIAFQAVIAAIEYFSRGTRNAQKATAELNVELEAQKNLLSSIALTTNEELNKTLKVLSAYSSEFKKLFEGLLNSQGANRESIIKLTSDYGQLLGIRRQIEAKEKAIGLLQEGQDKSRAKLLGEINQLRLDELALLDQLSQFAPIDSMDVDSVYDFGQDTYSEFKKGFTDSFIDEGYEGFFNVFKPEEQEPYFPFVDLKKLETQMEIEEEYDKQEKLKEIREKANKEKLEAEIATINAIADAKFAEVDIVESVFRSIADIAEGSRLVQALALVGESAAGIAKIVIDTQAGNAALRLQQAAVLAVNPALAAAIGLKIKANNIAASAGIAANVGSTATALSKLKAPVAPPGTPGLGGATDLGGGPQAPQFNVIGATGQNQLAAAIAATQQQPVKAYVVSNDVTTAQSLDRNIVAEASL